MKVTKNSRNINKETSLGVASAILENLEFDTSMTNLL